MDKQIWFYVVKHTSIRFEVVRFDSLDCFALNRYNVVKHTRDKKIFVYFSAEVNGC